MTDISPPQPRQRRDTPSPKQGGVSDKDLPPARQRQRRRAALSPEDEMLKLAAQDPSFTGKGTRPVFRDKDGKRIDEEDILKAKGDEKPKEKHIEWGKGLAQKRAAEARAQELEAEKSRPFARTRDDPELDTMLKNRIRWGDPMAHLVKRHKDADFLLDDLGDDEKMKESDFIVPQNIPSQSWLKRRGVDYPPKRYGIKPGRHWDGVDRSNGFEKEMYEIKD